MDPLQYFHFLLKLARNVVVEPYMDPQKRVVLASFKSIYVSGIYVEGVSCVSTIISTRAVVTITIRCCNYAVRLQI